MIYESLILMKMELILAVIILALLLIKVSSGSLPQQRLLLLVNGLLLANFVAGLFLSREGAVFGQMFTTNPLIFVEKNILNLGLLLISLFSYDWLKDHRHAIEFYVLILTTLLGLFFMMSSGNLLMFYLGLEMATIPLAALVNFDLKKRFASEAAMKLILSSAFSSAFLLFGISILYGTTGSLDVSVIASRLDGSAFQLLAFILVFGAFAFKVSAFPFHFWTADVYEGAPVPVTAYLSVVSKGAFFFALVPMLYHVFQPLQATWYQIVVVVAIMSMITGNLFALRQKNLKRLIAFSSVSQAGFLLAGVSGNSLQGEVSVVYFILVYLFSNLGALGDVTIISAATGRENISDYRGLYATNPLLCKVMALSLFSLAGIPPTAGFFGKFFLLIAGAERGNYVFITIASLNMVISLYYYLVVIRAMFVEEQPEPMQRLSIAPMPRMALYICAIAILLTGVFSWVYQYVHDMASHT